MIANDKDSDVHFEIVLVEQPRPVSENTSDNRNFSLKYEVKLQVDYEASSAQLKRENLANVLYVHQTRSPAG